MAETLYATYKDKAQAQAAYDELLNMGFKKEEMSLIDEHFKDGGKTDEGEEVEFTRPTTPMSGTEFRHGGESEILGNELRQLSVPRIEPVKDLQFDYEERFKDTFLVGGVVLGVTVRDAAMEPQIEEVLRRHSCGEVERHEAYLS
jgi:hypothetical protein